MENIAEIASVPVIMGATYLLIKIYKYWVHSEKGTRIIPGLAGAIGIILGLLAYKYAPDVMPAENFLMAMLIGGASGFSATGVNQLFKQLGKHGETVAHTTTPTTSAVADGAAAGIPAATLTIPATTVSIPAATALSAAFGYTEGKGEVENK